MYHFPFVIVENLPSFIREQILLRDFYYFFGVYAAFGDDCGTQGLHSLRKLCPRNQEKYSEDER